MTTVVRWGHGPWTQPVGRDEAEQWQWDRVCQQRMRGRYWCRFTGDPSYDCPAPLQQCCELGERKFKRGWRRYAVAWKG